MHNVIFIFNVTNDKIAVCHVNNYSPRNEINVYFVIFGILMSKVGPLA